METYTAVCDGCGRSRVARDTGGTVEPFEAACPDCAETAYALDGDDPVEQHVYRLVCAACDLERVVAGLDAALDDYEAHERDHGSDHHIDMSLLDRNGSPVGGFFGE